MPPAEKAGLFRKQMAKWYRPDSLMKPGLNPASAPMVRSCSVHGILSVRVKQAWVMALAIGLVRRQGIGYSMVRVCKRVIPSKVSSVGSITVSPC